MRISRLSGCDDGAHRPSERGIHQLLSGLEETLATVYWLRRELLRSGEEALFVRLNFIFFTDSLSELYGQRMYFWSSFKVPVIVVWFYWHLNYLDIFSKNIHLSNFMKIFPVWSELFHADGHSDGWTDGWTGRHEEANSRFSQFCEHP
jgi:hypothetical protein